MEKAAVTSNAEWVQASAMLLMVGGYDPNVVTRELCAYAAGHAYDFTIIHKAIEMMGLPPNPYDYHSNYNRARERWIETGNIVSLLEMIDAVTLDA